MSGQLRLWSKKYDLYFRPVLNKNPLLNALFSILEQKSDNRNFL